MKSVLLCLMILFTSILPVSAESEAGQYNWTDSDAQLRFAMRSLNASSESAAASGTSVGNLKQPKLGALMSAFIPGAGQIYGKSWIKGALFLGAEVALWMGYKHYRDEGDQLKVEFRAFANEHWIEARYWAKMALDKGDIPGVTEEILEGDNYLSFNYEDYLEGEDGLREYEKLFHSHSLHVVKDQQYYEMIGKYYQFEYGWDDFNPELHKVSPNRAYYEDLEYRKDSQYRNAGKCAMIVLGNHLISALDAVWTVKRANKSIQLKPQMGMVKVSQEWVPITGLALTW